MEKRSKVLDVAKAIAIILVVLGHCVQYGSGNEYWLNQNYLNNFTYKIIYSFHMPLFMLISGYLFFNSISKYTNKELIKRKIYSLVVPIFAFSTLELIYNIIFKLDNLSINSLISIYNGKLWFLWVVFWMSMLIIVINKLFKDNILIYLLLFIITFFCPFKLKLYGFMYPYFIGGYLFNKYNLPSYINKVKYKLTALVLLVIYSILLKYYDNNCYIFTTGVSIFNNNKQLWIDIYRLIIGFVGSSLILLIIKIICNRINNKDSKILKWTTYIGKNSLGIYAISNYLFIILKIICYNLKEVNYIILFIESVITIALSLLLIYLIKKNKYLSKLFLGI